MNRERYMAAQGSSKLGPELVVNGGFDSDTVWQKPSGWTISGGLAVCSGANAQAIYQALVGGGTGLKFKITFTIVSITSGSFSVSSGNRGSVYSSIGTYSNIISSTSPNVGIYPNGVTIGSIDNVSVKRVY